MDDVCPWDIASTVTLPERSSSTEATLLTSLEPLVCSIQGDQQQNAYSSSKNSQLDLCSSSSDVSIAIAEVSERLRKTSSIAEGSNYYHSHNYEHQQRQQISGISSSPIQRNYSFSSVQTNIRSAKIKFAETTRASISTCNFPSPQHSFDLSYVALVPAEILCGRQQFQRHPLNVVELPRTRSFTIVPEELEQQQSR
jgi:hypothetical protein